MVKANYKDASRMVQIVISVIALLGLLSYTFVHTGALLSKYVYPAAVGYACAFGIELSVVSLSLRIGELKRANQKAVFYYGVLFAVVFVSALANVASGYEQSTQSTLTVAGLVALDAAQAVVGFTATALVSLIVLAISEIIGVDVREAAKQSAKPAQDAAQAAQVVPYLCGACGEGFATSQRYAAHMRHAHRNGHAKPVAIASTIAS